MGSLVKFTLLDPGDLYGTARPNLQYLRRSAYALNSDSGFAYVDNDAEAQIRLFVDEVGRADHFYTALRKNIAARNTVGNPFLFTTHDDVIPYLPGVYSSLNRKRYSPLRQRAGFFLEAEFNKDLNFSANDCPKKFLGAYVGRGDNKPLRRSLMQIPRSRLFLRDTYYDDGDDPSLVPHDCLNSLFRELLKAASFAICPRGFGTSTIRVFEAMKVGCAPVIISDNWIPPEGIDWAACSIRVAEKEIGGLERILSRHEGVATDMGAAAQKIWHNEFSGENALKRILRECHEMSLKKNLRPSLFEIESFYFSKTQMKRATCNFLERSGLRDPLSSSRQRRGS